MSAQSNLFNVAQFVLVFSVTILVSLLGGVSFLEAPAGIES
jgi:hypothetical protein